MRNLSATLFALIAVLGPRPCPGAIDIRFDYTYDTGNFFSGANVGRRALLDAAANVFESRFTLENFGGITPSGGNTWSLSFSHPTTGSNVTINNPIVQPNVVTIYVGARDLGPSLLGLAEYNYSYSGNAAWVDLFSARDSATNFDSLGGAISFDSATPWYFDSNPLTLESFPGQYDFFSVAQHEIAHLLGFTIGTNAFSAEISGTVFHGANVVSVYGGPAPLASASDLGHWQEGLTFDGKNVLMGPTFFFGVRDVATELDFAAFKDIGYNVTLVPEPDVVALLALSTGACLARRRRAFR
jgi:hypothetical protein